MLNTPSIDVLLGGRKLPMKSVGSQCWSKQAFSVSGGGSRTRDFEGSRAEVSLKHRTKGGFVCLPARCEHYRK